MDESLAEIPKHVWIFVSCVNPHWRAFGEILDHQANRLICPVDISEPLTSATPVLAQ